MANVLKMAIIEAIQSLRSWPRLLPRVLPLVQRRALPLGHWAPDPGSRPRRRSHVGSSGTGQGAGRGTCPVAVHSAKRGDALNSDIL